MRPEHGATAFPAHIDAQHLEPSVRLHSAENQNQMDLAS